MKKINNKGFAISTVIYSILIIAILVMGMLYSTVAFRKKASSDFINNIEEDLTSRKIKSYTICRAATTLHEYISGTDDIVYGTLASTGVLKTGDAFDCDINGDNIFDDESERFYYVSPENGDTSSENVVLIYYSNSYMGSPILSGTVEYMDGILSSGTSGGVPSTYVISPTKLRSQLPTTSVWTNTALVYPEKRNITDENGTIRYANFDYSGYAARLLNLNELKSATNITISATSSANGQLSSYNFLMENLVKTSSMATGYWLEDVYSGDRVSVWAVSGSTIGVVKDEGITKTKYGVRPVIIINKNNLYY